MGKGARNRKGRKCSADGERIKKESIEIMQKIDELPFEIEEGIYYIPEDSNMEEILIEHPGLVPAGITYKYLFHPGGSVWVVPKKK